MSPRTAGVNYNLTTGRLLHLVRAEAIKLTEVEAADTEKRYKTLVAMWAIVQEEVGEYRERSFALRGSPQAVTEFKEAAHYMSILEVIHREDSV